jgi:hypothetical protein
MKRIIWIAQDKRHRIISVWYSNHAHSLRSWKRIARMTGAYHITKHYIEV